VVTGRIERGIVKVATRSEIVGSSHAEDRGDGVEMFRKLLDSGQAATMSAFCSAA